MILRTAMLAVAALLALSPAAEARQDGRPAHCPARRWCGCYLAAHLGLQDRSLWVARNWTRVGRSAGGPGAGVIAVWRHHVGLIKAVEGNRILVLSGNDGRRVRERWRTTSRIIAYRVP